MATFNSRDLAASQVALVWALHRSLVLVADYRRNGGAVYRQAVEFLVWPLRPAECDGSSLQAGDENCLVRVADLGLDFQPGSGDYLCVGDPGVRYTVISGVLEFGSAVWHLYVRRTNTSCEG